MGDLVIIQRTQSEIEAFGGDVYIDIDGKNVGIVKTQNLRFSLTAGKHKIKMYKSHTMGTIIGIAETELEINEDEKLYARYAAPLVTNQPGNIMIAHFKSENELNNIVRDIESSIRAEYDQQKENKQKSEIESKQNEMNLFIWIFIIPAIVGFLYWVIEMIYIW